MEPQPSERRSIRPSWLAGLLAIALLAAFGVVYLISRPDGSKPAAASTPPTPPPGSSAVVDVPPALKTTGDTCAVLSDDAGRAMRVSVELVNNSPRPIVLTAAQAVFPLGGLRQVDSWVSECGKEAAQPVRGHQVQRSATVWLSQNLTVQARCPARLPVQLEVDYTVDGRPVSQLLKPFPNLSDVPFPGCPTR